MGNTTYTDVLHEDELTSRHGPEKYYEAKKIYDEYDPSNQDRDKYEEELEKSVKPPTNIQNNQIEKTLTNTTDTDVLHEDELTSRNNPEKYYEAKKIFDEYVRSNPENCYEAKKILEEYVRINPENYYVAKKIFEEYYSSNQDRDKYEEEPNVILILYVCNLCLFGFPFSSGFFRKECSLEYFISNYIYIYLSFNFYLYFNNYTL